MLITSIRRGLTRFVLYVHIGSPSAMSEGVWCIRMFEAVLSHIGKYNGMFATIAFPFTMFMLYFATCYDVNVHKCTHRPNVVLTSQADQLGRLIPFASAHRLLRCQSTVMCYKGVSVYLDINHVCVCSCMFTGGSSFPWLCQCALRLCSSRDRITLVGSTHVALVLT